MRPMNHALSCRGHHLNLSGKRPGYKQGNEKLTEFLSITNLVDVVRFFQFLHDDSVVVHLGTVQTCSVDKIENPFFTVAETAIMEHALRASFYVCEKNGFDLNELNAALHAGYIAAENASEVRLSRSL